MQLTGGDDGVDDSEPECGRERPREVDRRLDRGCHRDAVDLDHRAGCPARCAPRRRRIAGTPRHPRRRHGCRVAHRTPACPEATLRTPDRRRCPDGQERRRAHGRGSDATAGSRVQSASGAYTPWRTRCRPGIWRGRATGAESSATIRRRGGGSRLGAVRMLDGWWALLVPRTAPPPDRWKTGSPSGAVEECAPHRDSTRRAGQHAVSRAKAVLGSGVAASGCRGRRRRGEGRSGHGGEDRGHHAAARG